MKKAWGGFVKGFAKFLDGFFGFLIAFIETLVNLTVGFRYVLGSILSFGCIFILFFPYIFFKYKWITFTVLFITIFPILGKGFVNYLKYVKYSMVEFLLGYGDYYLNNSQTKYTSYSDYKKKYIFNKQEEERKAREERQRREQEEWTRRFEEWSNKTDLASMILNITNNKVNTVDTTKVMVNKDMDIKTNTKIQWTILLELTNNIATRWELDATQTSTKSN